MEFKKIEKQEESRAHKVRSALRFLENLHTEIELAKKLEDIQDVTILKKFREYIEVLEQVLLKSK